MAKKTVTLAKKDEVDENKKNITEIQNTIGVHDISSLIGGANTITGILHQLRYWASMSSMGYLETSIEDFCKNDDHRGIVHTFQVGGGYQPPDAPEGYTGEAFIIKIPDASNIRCTILYIIYNGPFWGMYIGHYYAGWDSGINWSPNIFG